MAGPNSAPNGDAGLIRGHRLERFVLVKCPADCEKEHEHEQLLPARTVLARRNRLVTGKTKEKN